MTKPRDKRPPLCWPPSAEQIRDAVALAGYPLELRIHETLRSAGLDPIMPFRTPVRGGDHGTAEIDLLANMTDFAIGHDGELPRTARLSVKIFIQAKRLHEGAFVGFVGPDSPERERLIQRASVAGLPSWNVLRGDDIASDAIIANDGLAQAFRNLIVAPQCLHWAIVRLSGKGDEAHFRASQKDDRPVVDDFETLIRGIAWQQQDWSSYLLANTSIGSNANFPIVEFYWPLLVLDADMYAYDTHSNSVERKSWLTVRLGIDAEAGVRHRPIDVVTEAELPAMIARYKAAFADLKERFESKVLDFIGAAHGLLRLYQQQSTEPLRPAYISSAVNIDDLKD